MKLLPCQMMLFSKETGSTLIFFFELIIRRTIFATRQIQSTPALTIMTLCCWQRTVASLLIPSAMLASWVFTIQISFSPGQNLRTTSQDVLNFCGSGGLSSWQPPQVGTSAPWIKEGSYQCTEKTHLVSLTLQTYSDAVTLYLHLQMESNILTASHYLGIVAMLMIGSITMSTGM